jgi:opacity protein-like surface antigen
VPAQAQTEDTPSSSEPATATAPILNVRGHAAASWFQSPNGQGALVDPGFELGLGTGWEVWNGLEVTLEGTFSRYAGNENELVLNLANLFPGEALRSAGGDVETWAGAVGLRYTYVGESPAHPYVAAAVGYYAYSAQRADVFQATDGGEVLIRRAPAADLTAYGYQLAIGVSFQLSDRYAFFVEPRLVVARTSNDRRVFNCTITACDGTGESDRFVTVRDQSTQLVPVRLGLRFRPWGTGGS